MLPPQVPNWMSTAHLPHLSASIEKRSPPPQRSPSPPPQPTDPDAPLNLTKPKSSSSGSPGSSPHSVSVNLHNPAEQPVAATAPKLLPPSLMMPRAFLPYAGLPPQFSPLPPNTERHKSNKDSMMNPDKSPFAMHMYGLPTPQQLQKSREDGCAKEEADFIAACHSKYMILNFFLIVLDHHFHQF